ncbi:MAG: hypothetical protein QOE70_3902 [Chthoniobacter sp.]|jgi:hypothetical protein|nr:hypothetical protein [Chthoniobacter sp.]
MKNQSAHWVIPVWLCLGGLVVAQEKSAPAAPVEGIKGVREDAVETVKHVETGNSATNTAQGVNKINGVETINGVKEDGRTVVPPTNPPPPPPPIVSAGGTAIPAGGGSVGSAANIRAIKGVSGINSAKLQNLEKALILKQGGGGTPTGAGAEKGGKGKSAAAALLASPLEKKPGPKEDGRAGFQEFEKLQNNGS